MMLVTIIYVTDMEAAIDFYIALGATLGRTGRNPYWTEMTLGGSAFALHITDGVRSHAVPQIGVAVASSRSLEAVAAELAEHAIVLDREIADEAFGRSMSVRDPSGLVIQINEHDPDLHPG